MTEKNPYAFHGIDTADNDNKWTADCPFCGKENKWCAFKDDHRYSCFTCGETGNLYTFLGWLIRSGVATTTDEEYAELSEMRGIPVATLKRFRVCKSILTNEWLIPTFTSSGRRKTSCVNVGRYVKTPKGFKVFTTPTCKQHLYNTHTIKKPHTPLIICEGQFDCMILDHVLRSENSRKDYELVAVPGANVFKPEQAKILSTRRIILIYDNDDAGAKGVKRVVKEAAELVDRPTSIQHLVWDETKGKGYDVRDLYHSYSE